MSKRVAGLPLTLSSRATLITLLLAATHALAQAPPKSPATPPPTTALDGAAIKHALIGNSVQHIGNGNGDQGSSSYTVYYPEYGVLLGSAGPWGLFTDRGTWSVDNNGLYCARWQRWQDQQRLCYRVYLDSERKPNPVHWRKRVQWHGVNGQAPIIDLLRPGNPGNLK